MSDFSAHFQENASMTKLNVNILAGLSLAATASMALAQAPSGPSVPVTVDNYNRAQTDVYFAGAVKNAGLGKLRHGRELAPVTQRGIIRPNRDTLYSMGVFDLDAGPVTVTLPDAGSASWRCR
ncbi:DUF1254 domain-containing protein [Paraburkholderia sp. CI3]|uniref:DUF1254 domain-containing protein n=1 Tax=Paraburkholderia sp. CI3 TaxID=2991060 RepID=UPI003D1A3455